MDFTGTIPETGYAPSTVLKHMRSLRGDDFDWRAGKTWSLVYHAGEKHEKLLRDAHGMFLSENFLNPMAFSSLKRMERDVVRMTADMLHGSDQVVGTMSSGGTESIMLAVKAARERFRSKHRWLRPQVLAPASVHVAFEKACDSLGLELVHLPLEDDFRVDVSALKRKLSRHTALVAASAPQFPHGVIDPIQEIALLTEKRDIPFHVDACIGGFMLPWLEQLGAQLPQWDFRVPGVTSISADVHKFGYAAKGASVILYRDMSYMTHQFFISTDWVGGVYISPTMAGTRPGGPIAAAWAAIQGMGRSGYRSMASQAMEATKRYLDGLARIPELEVLGSPDMSLVAVASADEAVDVFAVADQLEKRGWHPDRQQFPPSLHVTITAHHLEVIDDYLDDLRAAVDYVVAHPDVATSGTAPMYGMLAKVPLRGLAKRSVRKVMEKMFAADARDSGLDELSTEANQDDMMGRIVQKYEPQLLQLFDRVQRLKTGISYKLRRGR